MLCGFPGIPGGDRGSLGGIHGSPGGTDGTLGPMGPWDRWDLGLKDRRYFLRGYFLQVVLSIPGPAQPGPVRPGPVRMGPNGCPMGVLALIERGDPPIDSMGVRGWGFLNPPPCPS